MYLSKSFDRWVFHAYDACAPGLGIYRIFFALSILILTGIDHTWISKFPDSFFVPPIGLGIFFRGFPPIYVFYVLAFVKIFATLCVLVGYWTRSASFVLALSLLVGNTWSYSFGKINHDILLIMVPLVMSVSGWGRTYSLDARAFQPPRRCPSWPITLLAMLVGFTMFTAGLPKLTSGWLDPHTQAVQGHLIHNYFIVERHTWLATHAIKLESPILWEVADLATVIIELSFLGAILSCRWMRLVCALACYFHAGIFFMMDIFFTPNLIAYAVFVNWERLIRFLPNQQWINRLRLWQKRIQWPHLLLATAAVFCLYFIVGNPFDAFLSLFFENSLFAKRTILCAASLGISTAYLVSLVRRQISRRGV